MVILSDVHTVQGQVSHEEERFDKDQGRRLTDTWVPFGEGLRRVVSQDRRDVEAGLAASGTGVIRVIVLTSSERDPVVHMAFMSLADSDHVTTAGAASNATKQDKKVGRLSSGFDRRNGRHN